MGLSRVSVEVRNGDINKSLKIFKKKVLESGHLDELKERRYFTKPTTKRRLQKQQAVRRNNIEVEKERERNRY
jgi:small subunit ribosomal protein S21